MKARKATGIAAAVIGIIVLAVFTTGCSAGNGRADEELLTLTVDYSSVGGFFEIGKDITVSAKGDFTDPLRLLSCKVENGNYVYVFTGENASAMETVYVKPPVLYKPTGIEPLSTEAAEGKTVQTSAGSASGDWFTVRSLELAESAKGIYTVEILIDPVRGDLPRSPKLCVGDREYGGMAELSFDANGNFTSGQFRFQLDAASENEARLKIAEASLEIAEALIRVDAPAMVVSSPSETLNIVVVGEGS